MDTSVGRKEKAMEELRRTPANCTLWELYVAQLKEFIRAVRARDHWRVVHAQQDVRKTRELLRILSR